MIRPRRLTRACATAAAVAGLVMPPAAVGAAGGSRRAAAPRLLSLTYGVVRPAGAPARYRALVLRATEPHGQIIEVVFEQLGRVSRRGDALGRCGLGGRRNGGVESIVIPIVLRPGIYRFRVTGTGALCGRIPAPTRTAERTFTIDVR